MSVITIDWDHPIFTGIVYSVLSMMHHDLPVNRPPGPRQHLRLLRDDDRPLRRQLQLQHQHVGDVRATVHPDGRGRALALHPQVAIAQPNPKKGALGGALGGRWLRRRGW